eukprot:scaffold9760_cov117-Alexandrium_tamarense.AAC.13
MASVSRRTTEAREKRSSSFGAQLHRIVRRTVTFTVLLATPRPRHSVAIPTNRTLTATVKHSRLMKNVYRETRKKSDSQQRAKTAPAGRRRSFSGL